MEKLENEPIEKERYIKNTTMGFLSDPTGYGKTASIIGLIMRDKREWDCDFFHQENRITTQASNLIVVEHIAKRHHRVNKTLIVVPVSIFKQWEDELSLSDLKVYVVKNIKQVNKFDKNLDCDVVLVSNKMYNELVFQNAELAWKRFVCDEPGNTRIPKMRKPVAGFYWFVTATPNNIPAEYKKAPKSFIKNIMEDVIASYECLTYYHEDIIIKNSDEFAQISFKMPETLYHYHKCRNSLSKLVEGMVSGAVEEYVSAGDIESAIRALGGGKTSNVLELVKRKKKEELEKIGASIAIYTIREDEKNIEKWVEEKKKIETQLIQLDERFSDILTEKCHICLEPLTGPVLEPGCQNIFCGECLLLWLKTNSSCPLCRCSVDPMNLIYIATEKDKEKTKHNRIIKPTKPEMVLELLKEKPTGKFLVFSHHDRSFNTICKYMDEKSIRYGLIKGLSREKTIDEYKNGDLNIIMLNSKFNGAGLNFQETTDIIVYHKMGSSVLTQIIGRANRLGRKTSVNVHYLEDHY